MTTRCTITKWSHGFRVHAIVCLVHEKGAEQRYLSATKKKGKLTTLTVKGLHIYATKKEIDVGDQHCDKWFNHQVRKAEEDPSRKWGQLLQPERLHLAQQSLKEWIWVGQIFPHSRREREYKALSSFQQLFPTIFIISLILSIFLWDWYVVLFVLF